MFAKLCRLGLLALALQCLFGLRDVQAFHGAWGHRTVTYYGSGYGWDGFYPSYSRWAYSPSYTSLSISVRAPRYAFPRYSVSGFGFPGYGWTTSYWYRPTVFPRLHSHFWHRPYYPTYSSYSFVYPTVVARPIYYSTYYSVPRFYPSTFEWPSTYYGTGYYGAGDCGCVSSACDSCSGATYSDSAVISPVVVLPRSAVKPVVSAGASSLSGESTQLTSTGRLVSGQVTAPLETVPMEALSAADTLFAAGGYAQAAAAYARLTVRYGNHDELSARRFVALVASGDCHQASVVFELAAANGRSIRPEHLPVGGLASLYASRATQRTKHADQLAQYALQHASEAVPLAMVGTWLELDGQAERALPFMQRAAELSADTPQPTSIPLLVSDSRAK